MLQVKIPLLDLSRMLRVIGKKQMAGTERLSGLKSGILHFFAKDLIHYDTPKPHNLSTMTAVTSPHPLMARTD